MYFLEQDVLSMHEAMTFFQETTDPSAKELMKETLIDPVVNVLETKDGRKRYITLGNEFLEVNAEMLAKEYPTKAVSFPRKYVNEVIELFGFSSVEAMKKLVTPILKQVAPSDFKTIINSPTNIIHTIVLSYSDMKLDKDLRDSARHQTGLTVYNVMWNKYFGHVFNENVMAYTYTTLNGTWSLVKAENMMNWIGQQVETSYGFYKTALTLKMTPETLVAFLNRLRTTFNQSMKGLCSRFREDMANGNSVGQDVDGEADYLETNSFSTLRDNMVRLIRNGDPIYTKKGDMYSAMARYKNVKLQDLYNLAQKVDYKDIGTLIDIILYVFVTKEGNKIEDVNSNKYISRISNFPTAVDRAIAGKPIIDPYCKKYKADENIIRAYICFIATYIMYRINECKPEH